METYTKEEVAALPLCTETELADYFNSNYSMLLKSALRYVIDQEDAEDIVAESLITMITALRKEKLRGPKGIKAGFIRTIDSRGIDKQRQNDRWKRNIQAGMDAGHEVSLTASPQAHLMYKEDTKALSAVIPSLIAQESNERAQEVLTYVFLKGFNQIEAAEAAGMSYRHAKRLIETFRKRVTDDS